MTAQKMKTVQVERSGWTSYWERATELFQSMKMNLGDDRLNAAVIDAVQCAISISDAFTIARLGLRCASQSHSDATALFSQASVSGPVNPHTHRLTTLLSIKSHVEYGPSLVRPQDARKVSQDVERLYMWVASQLKVT